MRLRRLLDPGVVVESHDNANPEIEALTADSRDVSSGTLFAALVGTQTDGRHFIDDAVRKGAVAILTDPSMSGRDLDVPLILDPEPRRRLALMASVFFGAQSKHVVAVTGTSGKTSVASMVRQIWSRLGHASAALGTLGLQSPVLNIEGGLTTPDPVHLHKLLADLAGQGVDHLAMEASSHGLDQRRLDGIAFEAAAFTNLSRDHLDYHASLTEYLAAKARLFSELLPDRGVAVLNADAAEFDHLNEICKARNLDVIDYGRGAERLRLDRQDVHPDGQRLRVSWENAAHDLNIKLIGNFQASNLLASVGLLIASGDENIEAVLSAAEGVEGVPGRLQLVGQHPSGARVFVDYAHKPDALENVLKTLRPYAAGRLVVVFGCGGDRDVGKRPMMGKIAARCADQVFITDDNPRSEDPALIRRAILDSCPGAVEVGDRADAIHQAVRKLDVGDVLVVAGKGHETGQIVGDSVLPFDDVVVTKAALAGLMGPDRREPAPLLHGNGR